MIGAVELGLALLALMILAGCALEWYFDSCPIRDEDEELGDRLPLHVGTKRWGE